MGNAASSKVSPPVTTPTHTVAHAMPQKNVAQMPRHGNLLQDFNVSDYDHVIEKRENEKKKKKERILQEFPELKNALELIKISMKELNSQKILDLKNKNISLSSKRTLDELDNYYSEFEQNIHRQFIGDEISTSGGAITFFEYLNLLTKNQQQYPMEGYNYECYETLRSILWNFTDMSLHLAQQVGQVGILTLMIKDLKKLKDSFKTNQNESFIVMSSMCIIANCSRLSENTKYLKPEIEIISWYAKNTNDMPENCSTLPQLSNLTLAYIVDEQNNDFILANQDIIKSILELLESSMTSQDHRSAGFSALELTEGLTKLANNQENSLVIAKMGVLESLRLMLKQGSTEEKVASAKLVWVLAFTQENKKTINSNQEIIQLLEQYSSKHSVSEQLSTTSTNALWVLKMNKSSDKKPLINKKRVAQTSQDVVQTKVGKKQNHVMISYQWDCQQLMLKIKEGLQQQGYKVWMDVEEMGGSTLESMASAVEQSEVILVCMSQKYKDSPSCRTEAEYAYTLRKDFIPLRVETDYKPDGWLGAIAGAKFYFDFSNNLVEQTLIKLVKELGERGKTTRNNEETHFEPLVEKEIAENLKKQIITEWTNQDVHKWAVDNNLKSLKSQNIDGKVLYFLTKLKKETPEFFYQHSTKYLRLKDFSEIMRFAQAIEKLS